jgi:hypothetical protein
MGLRRGTRGVRIAGCCLARGTTQARASVSTISFAIFGSRPVRPCRVYIPPGRGVFYAAGLGLAHSDGPAPAGIRPTRPHTHHTLWVRIKNPCPLALATCCRPRIDTSGPHVRPPSPPLLPCFRGAGPLLPCESRGRRHPRQPRAAGGGPHQLRPRRARPPTRCQSPLQMPCWQQMPRASIAACTPRRTLLLCPGPAYADLEFIAARSGLQTNKTDGGDDALAETVANAAD